MFPVILFASVLLSAFSFGKTIEYTETILTVSGSLRGEEVEIEGIKFKAFKGIPYAAPPVGKNRFKDPQPPEVWDDVKNVVAFGHICHQGVPLGQDALQPVLFYIHGDGFFVGDGTDTHYGPEFLVDQDLVVVTFNYRLGPLGFLATGTEDAPGNWGLKDQVAALKWVNENIAVFGGDPNKVTIYGQGSGASSAHLHLWAPLSKGLFDKVILSSGTADSCRALTFDHERFSENLAKYLGATAEQVRDPTKRVEFLRDIDAKNMSVSMWQALEVDDISNSLGISIPFLPVLEPPKTENYFMIEEPYALLIEGNFTKVPMMIGFNSNEGAFEMNLPRFKIKERLKQLDEYLCLAVPQPTRVIIEGKKECPKVAETIRKIYFGGQSIMDQKENLTKLAGDSIYVSEIDYAQHLHAKHSKEGQFVYNYYFTYDGEWNMMKDILTNMIMHFEVPGAIRGDELFYLFNPRFMKLPLREPSKPGLDTKARMLSFISNFVKTGNPTPALSDLVPILWEPAQEGKPNTMVIDADIKLEQEVLRERMRFWEDIYERYDPPNDNKE